MAYFIFLKYVDNPEDFRNNPHVKISLKSPCANFQSLGIFKNPIFIQKRTLLRFRPIRPSPASAGRFAPQAAGSTLSPFGPSSPGVFAKRCISFDFAHFGNDAFTLSRHCHVGPARQLHPLPADRSHSCRPLLLVTSSHPVPPGLQHQDANQSLHSPALIPLFNSPLNPLIKPTCLQWR
jgi:hypothetical protein